jgi:hypothetical protein
MITEPLLSFPRSYDTQELPFSFLPRPTRYFTTGSLTTLSNAYGSKFIRLYSTIVLKGSYYANLAPSFEVTNFRALVPRLYHIFPFTNLLHNRPEPNCPPVYRLP